MQDGHVVYQGLPAEVPQHFRDYGVEFKHFANPADVLMKLLSVTYPKTEAMEKVIQGYVDFYNLKQHDAVVTDNEKYALKAIDLKQGDRNGFCT